jgi:hypothetical protein
VARIEVVSSANLLYAMRQAMFVPAFTQKTLQQPRYRRFQNVNIVCRGSTGRREDFFEILIFPDCRPYTIYMGDAPQNNFS